MKKVRQNFQFWVCECDSSRISEGSCGGIASVHPSVLILSVFCVRGAWAGFCFHERTQRDSKGKKSQTSGRL